MPTVVVVVVVVVVMVMVVAAAAAAAAGAAGAGLVHGGLQGVQHVGGRGRRRVQPLPHARHPRLTRTRPADSDASGCRLGPESARPTRTRMGPESSGSRSFSSRRCRSRVVQVSGPSDGRSPPADPSLIRCWYGCLSASHPQQSPALRVIRVSRPLSAPRAPQTGPQSVSADFRFIRPYPSPIGAPAQARPPARRARMAPPKPRAGLRLMAERWRGAQIVEKAGLAR